MALLCTIKETVLLAAKREVSFIDSNHKNLYRLGLPEFDPKTTKSEENNDEQHDDEFSKKKLIASSEEFSSIQHIAVSPNEQLLAITTSGDKLVYMYKILAKDKHELVAKRALCRTSSALTFSSDSRYLYIADKTGDCYSFDCEYMDIPGKWILGHLSMVLDVLVTEDNRFLITSDRDEKIRVTNNPATHLIETYCLGHIEYVSAIAFLPTKPNDLLISISGDKTLKIWKFIEGMELFDYNLPAAGLKMIVRKIDTNISHIVVTLFEGPNLVIYEVMQCDEEKFVLKLLSEHTFVDSKEISSMLYETDGSVLLTTISEKNCVKLHRLVYTGGMYAERDLSELNQIIGDTLLDLPYSFGNISILFKKRYDNIKDYHERKKRRIEDQIRNS